MTVRIRVIPCLDVAEGRVVKGVNFVDLIDAGDPVEQARAYDAAGADELCFLDISATHEGRGTLVDIVRRTAQVCFMPLTVGGGVRSARTRARCCWRGPTRSRSIPPPSPGPKSSPTSPTGSARNAWSPRSMRGAFPERTAGKSSPMAAASRPASTRSNTRARLAELGAGELLVTSMDGDGTKARL